MVSLDSYRQCPRMTVLLQARDVSQAAGERLLFAGLELVINEGERPHRRAGSAAERRSRPQAEAPEAGAAGRLAR